MVQSSIHIGIDIGSVTVKVVAYDPVAGKLLWSGYKRHHARQQETANSLLSRVRSSLGLSDNLAVAVTGSGAQEASENNGLPFIQEVNALVKAVRTLYPNTRSIIELGGEDAKMVSIKALENGEAGVYPVMNEKCAAGTGSMIDRMTTRMEYAAGEAGQIPYFTGTRHPVSAKCGVFAETDIVGLLKNGVARDELLRALFDAIVQQNLSTLARGCTPRPQVLLLGGPHHYYHGLVQCWRHRLLNLWEERGIAYSTCIEDSVIVPDEALFLPAIGAVLEQASRSIPEECELNIEDRLRSATRSGRGKTPSRIAFSSEDERRTFSDVYTPPVFESPDLGGSALVLAHLGIDCGSTSIKAVLLDEKFSVLRKEFAFATHDPIRDTQKMLRRLRESVLEQGAELEIVSVGTTGYAKDLLAAALHADTAVVETVAHKESAHWYFPHADVICDVGGQDIKVILLEQGGVSDFRLNTQCSAGTGYFLQSVAERFDTSLDDFAEKANSASYAPEFSAGCTIFLQSDIVNFMRAGYTPAEIMAGVVQVLPHNIWVYAARIYDLPSAGEVFVLQGGTQRNLAAVRAQVQYIRDAFRYSDREPAVHVHPHPAEAGAIGCAVLAAAGCGAGGSSWIGFDGLDSLEYESEQSENTRCSGCSNQCARTVLHLNTHSPVADSEQGLNGESVIIAPCERGRATDKAHQRRINLRTRKSEAVAPNYARLLESAAFSPRRIAEELRALPGCEKMAVEPATGLEDIRICIPRVLNLHSHAPLFIAWFLAMGIRAGNIIISPRTTRRMSSTDSARGTVDPCFPVKICFAHVQWLLRHTKKSASPAWLFFPAIHRLPGKISDAVDCLACTVAAVIPEVTKTAYTMESDEFARHGVRYLQPFLSLQSWRAFGTTMAACFESLLHASPNQFHEAAVVAWRFQEHFMFSIQEQAKRTLDSLKRDKRLGIVLLGRPYHADRGLNHGILDSLQRMGFPLFTAETLPCDSESLSKLYGQEDGLSIRDVWTNPFSENSNRKMWAAKYAARHPNLLAVELSNFKCGHDAPTYSVVRDIFQAAEKPCFSFLDLDENTPQNTLNIRLETTRHFLETWCRTHGFALPRNKHEDVLCVPHIA